MRADCGTKHQSPQDFVANVKQLPIELLTPDGKKWEWTVALTVLLISNQVVGATGQNPLAVVKNVANSVTCL